MWFQLAKIGFTTKHRRAVNNLRPGSADSARRNRTPLESGRWVPLSFQWLHWRSSGR